ncbi:MAG: hypothetical protein V1660_03815 [archaeon]
MAKIPAAQARLFKNAFICKDCNAKIRIEPRKILEGKVKCRRCKGRAFRAMKKK